MSDKHTIPSKEDVLKHLKEDVYVRVGPSKIHGVGLIAVRDIPKGTDPFKNLYDPPTYAFSEEDLKDVPPGVRSMVKDYFGREEGLHYIPATGTNPLDVLHFINHSSEPNVHTINEGSVFVAVRDIQAGEELFADYRTYDEGFHDMKNVKEQ